MLIEDDAANVEFFTDVLEGARYAVMVERDGLSGRDRALLTPVDLIILDIQLPRLRGDDVCRALRAHGIMTPIIALSADALPHQIEAGMTA
ncbi:MAG: response regulator [Chloroflexi bacterium]|nr:MAG: response regulator [Chloroflexota bacterium]